jgi:hypothetical protein
VIETAGSRADSLALVEEQTDRLCFKFVIEPSARAPAFGGLCHRSGHRIHLSEDVHQTGSSAPASCDRLHRITTRLGRARRYRIGHVADHSTNLIRCSHQEIDSTSLFDATTAAFGQPSTLSRIRLTNHGDLRSQRR